MNQQIFYFLNNFAGQSICLDSLIIFCSKYLIFWVVVFFVCCYLCECSKTKELLRCIKSGVIIIFSSFAIWGVSQIINSFYYSPRPFLVLDELNLLFVSGNGDSFPSGHTTFIFTLAFMSYYCCSRWMSNFFVVVAFLIALSRIIAGVHWPLDIVGGIILAGVGTLLIKKYFLNRFKI